jgi:hypothetical protein
MSNIVCHDDDDHVSIIVFAGKANALLRFRNYDVNRNPSGPIEAIRPYVLIGWGLVQPIGTSCKATEPVNMPEYCIGKRCC